MFLGSYKEDIKQYFSVFFADVALTLSLPDLAKSKFRSNFEISFSEIWKQIAAYVSTGREVSFEWSHHRIWTGDSNVRVTLQNSIKHSSSERVEKLAQRFLSFIHMHPWHPL